MPAETRATGFPDTYAAPILVDVVREHLDEVTFLSIQRSRIVAMSFCEPRS